MTTSALPHRNRPGVLHLLSSFFQGGSERQALQLARLLKANGRYRIHIASLSGEGTLRSDAESLVSDIHIYPLTSFHDLNAAVQLRRFAKLLDTAQIDIVQSHDFYSNVFGMVGATWARVPARIAARRETSGVRTRAQSFVERGAYRLAHAIVANAGAIREQLVKEGVSRAKIEVIHNGLDLVRYTPAPDRNDVLDSMALPRGLRYVTIVANMHHSVKDHPTFLRAARRVVDAVPDAGFALAGEGPLLESLRALATDFGLAERAFFLGRCTRVAELLAVSEVCVLASLAEGFPNAVLEYMAAARPVVSTDVGGVREAISDGETGYLVAPGDFECIAAKVISLLRDPDTACAMGRRARKIVEETFSCEAQLNRTEALYARLLSGT